MATPKKWGSEFVVTPNAPYWFWPQLATLDTEGFALARTGGSVHAPGVRPRLFDASGAERGAEFPVNRVSTQISSDAQLFVLGEGRFLAEWSEEPGLSKSDVAAGIFNADGTGWGAEFQLTFSTAGCPRH